MSALRAILDAINDVEATISRVERAASGESPLAVQLSLQSLETRRDSLRQELAEITKHEFVDVCDYRIIPAHEDSYANSAVTTALHDFQDMVTYVFDAITSKPKRRAYIQQDVIEKTRFNFGFAYAGSLGIILTIRNERLLFGGSELDRAVAAVFDSIKAGSGEKIREVAERYGVPTVRKLYTWSKAHADYGMSAEIRWIRDSETKTSVLAQPSELAEICRIIESRGEETDELVSVTGTLVGYNVTRHNFMMEFPDAEPISGIFAEGYDGAPKVVPERYTASLIKRTSIPYASDKDVVVWLLKGLSEAK